MTTIAWDTKTMAADSQSTIGDTPIMGEDKLLLVRRAGVGRGMLVGICGSAARGLDLLNGFCGSWRFIKEDVRLGRIPALDTNDRATVMVIVIGPAEKYRHRTFLITHDGNVTDITMRPFAIGSGGDFAMGAMSAGAAALKAVRIASELDVFTNAAPLAYKVDDLYGISIDGFKELPI